jgi:exopolysaccharide biosynthesis polyprenyl glycosylphosphotransferase
VILRSGTFTSEIQKSAETHVTDRPGSNGSNRNTTSPSVEPAVEREILREDAFKRMIAIERKRTERSAKPFLLMLLEVGDQNTGERNGQLFAKVTETLIDATRETDVIGWYKDNSCMGVLFTQLMIFDQKSILSAMLERVGAMLRDKLSLEQFSQISISFHFFPDKWDHEISHRPSNPKLYPDLQRADRVSRLFSITKRVMDVMGSVLLLTLLSPILCAVALAVRLSSKGPILYRQQRVGQFGKPFTFLKFRSMYVNNDSTVHKHYVMELIAGKAKRHATDDNAGGAGVYKLTKDVRVTRVGAFIRRTSLDELPQLFNVLCGEMSLVGPRPAIPYEVAAYQTWHRRRVLEVKPGITGLWQINGRGRVAFDDMVRLDLRYAREWSPWLDLKILLRTPRAVIVGEGAY